MQPITDISGNQFLARPTIATIGPKLPTICSYNNFGIFVAIRMRIRIDVDMSHTNKIKVGLPPPLLPLWQLLLLPAGLAAVKIYVRS